jgi:hypothetical protein
MSFIVAGLVLLLALLASIVIVNIGIRKCQKNARRDIPSFDPWRPLVPPTMQTEEHDC